MARLYISIKLYLNARRRGLTSSPVVKLHIFDEPCIEALQRFFLTFLYLQAVLFQNLNDATLSSLGNSHNMQIKSAITEITIFDNIEIIVFVSKNCLGIKVSLYIRKCSIWIDIDISSNSNYKTYINMEINLHVIYYC